MNNCICNRVIKKLFYIIPFGLWSLSLNAQDIHFSQFWNTPQLLNPASVGAFTGDIKVITNYKDQWRSIVKPYRTFAFSYEMKFMQNKWKKNYLGVGMYAFNDRAGDLGFGKTEGNLSLSYHLMLGDNNYISGGIHGGIGQRGLKDISDAQWGSQYDGTGYNSSMDNHEDLNTFTENRYYGDIASGVQWNFLSSDATMTSNDGVKTEAGFSFQHLIRPQQTFFENGDDRLNTKMVFHTNTSIGVRNTNIAIQPGGFIFIQGTQKEIFFGTNIRYTLIEGSKYTGFIQESALSLGGFYRLGDAIVIPLMLEITNWALGISYDINVSGLSTISNGRGGLEFSVRYITPNPFTSSRARF